MYTAQQNSNTEMEQELPQVSPGQPKDMREIHKYNLRPRPTKRNSMYSMYNMTQASFAKPHVNVMITQMNMKEGISKFGDKLNESN